jgi:RimJ/RimL family protein N-acetyltransferase
MDEARARFGETRTPQRRRGAGESKVPRSPLPNVRIRWVGPQGEGVGAVKKLEFALHAPRIGAGMLARALATELWSAKTFLGLRADLRSLTGVAAAKVPVVMRAWNGHPFSGFDTELGQTRGTDHVQVLFRTWLARAGVRTLYVATDEDGDPIYAQWLIRRHEQPLLEAHAPGRYSALEPGQILLEGAYTFTRYRRRGAMADGMAQLLALAAGEGAATALTYVEIDNVASLRGCAQAGFLPEHVRRNQRHCGRLLSVVSPPDRHAVTRWETALSPSRSRCSERRSEEPY